ncbi:MAG: 23S rRNA (uracil(1939)-C(5))-methyltransferase RlmD [Spirochaetes bacterium]|nr:23S rRNA (uracil(1939)-C(5))-methyltransferase RlmD [Spirochaetota bacterium]
MKKKKRLEFQRLIEEYRGEGTLPECPHFGECGGCLFQDVPYENQLLLKREYCNGILAGLGGVDRIVASEPYRYRNRMDMVTAFGRVGLRRAGRYRDVVDVTTCPLMQARSDELFKALRGPVLETEGYDYLAHRGYLRYIVLRQAMFTGQLMVSFVVAARENRLEGVVDAAAGGVDSVSLLFNDGLADTSFGEPFATIKEGWIEERFESIRFRITPNSFFQSNSAVALAMYRRIRDSVEGRVLDLYSGVGSISLFVAERALRVTGVEMVREAVECALANRDLNGIANAEFICADARAYLRERQDDFDTVIFDPPRSGMHPKMLRYLNDSGPRAMIYMSCNPSAFAAELRSLDRYSLQWIEAYDMFPQTPHLETLALLMRR